MKTRSCVITCLIGLVLAAMPLDAAGVVPPALRNATRSTVFVKVAYDFGFDMGSLWACVKR